MRRGIALLVLLSACRETPAPQAPKPSILLVTLDTTRADAIGADTPNIAAFAARARRFTRAYAAVPQTLASHGSMMTGLYPAGHGVHENGRYFAPSVPMLAEKLKQNGYATAAFVSAFAVARRFGLGRGFDVYDDDFGGDRAERPANETTDRAIAWLQQSSGGPRFLWVHYYDPHFPYAPPPPFAARYAGRPYFGEVAFMDEQLGRLLRAFTGSVIVVADHGEGLGDHGEPQHGNLLYQSTMHVPLFAAGPGMTAGTFDAPISTRHVFDMILAWSTGAPVATPREVVVGEAMKPFLDYGWQPQVMAVEGRLKAILSGERTELYDVIADPGETRDLYATAGVPRESRAVLREYPLPTLTASATEPVLNDEERKKLASLGYVASAVAPVIRKGAPRPADMTHLFGDLDAAAALFVAERYGPAIPLLQRILAADSFNLEATLRLATAHSALGHDREAEEAFRRAAAIAPDSLDVWTFFALHLAKGDQWQRAVPMLERVIAEDPDRFPAIQALAALRERQGRIADAIALRQKLYARRNATGPELVRLGELAMETGNTPVAIDAFEKARRIEGKAFAHDLELGVLFLATRRFPEARDALDRVPPSDRRYPLAAFKRAQVSVLLHEPDAARRIAVARENADATTGPLIARERLFVGVVP